MIIDSTIPAKSISYGSSRKASAIKYIVVHYTGNTTDKAVNNAKYYANSNTRAAGAHYFVDENDTVYQSIPDLKVAYAVGGSKYSDCSTTGGGSMYGVVTNANSISIEMCSSSGAIAAKTIANAVTLVKKLMKTYSIPAANVYRHLDVNGKHCPGWAGWLGSDTSKWKAFKEQLTTTTTTTTTTTVSYYKKYTGTSTSIVVALGAVGEKNTSLNNRKKIATANSIKSYTGTAAQNEAMLKLLKAGKLKKA